MQMNQGQQKDIERCLLDMGELLLDCGAEVSRAEDTVRRMGMAFGAKKVEIFIITSIISLSLRFSEEEEITATRRIYSSSGTDFYRLEKLNELSRNFCAQKISLEELRERLDHIAQGKKPRHVILLGSVLVAGSFAVFFGGNWTDGIVSALVALGICQMQARLESTRVTHAGENLLISLLMGLCVGFLTRLIPQLHMDKILIGDIMLLIPGLAMTNSIRNILVGNTISGLIRLTESLIWAVALAGGVMTAILIVNLF